MGDRANVHVPTEGKPAGEGIYLYTHWGGYELPINVRDALKKQWRWDDPAYLTRIIFDQMIRDDHGSETGFGISTGICDNEHPIIVVDPARQTVRFAPARWDAPPQWQSGPSWSFAQYIELSDDQIAEAYTTKVAQ